MEIDSTHPALAALLSGQQGHVIDGERVASAGEETFETIDPATEEVLATVSFGGPEDADRAVAAARRALEGPWGGFSAAARERALVNFADLLEEYAVELATLETLDNGKPLTLSRALDVELAIAHFRYYAGWPTKIDAEVIPVAQPQMLCYTRKQPVGVCAQVIPWNYPLLMAAWKLAPALAAGCTVVLKPAEETPLSALWLGDLALEAGIPPGVVNVLAGDGATGAALVQHPGVDKIAFTGSTEVGREIGMHAGRALKRVTLELGGKSPNIVLPDADLGAAVEGAFEAIYFNAGQSCNAGSRLFVHRDQFDQVVSALAEIATATEPGPGLEPGSRIGPLVSARHRDRVMDYVEQGGAEGGELLAGGRALDRPGFFMEPTLFAVSSDEAMIARYEIFGPVLVALPYDSVEEVLRRANDTEFGLAAGIWTGDLAAGHRFAAELDAGTVYLNTWHAADPAAPFGGFKASGIGREMGFAGLAPYLEEKTVWASLSAPAGDRGGEA